MSCDKHEWNHIVPWCKTSVWNKHFACEKHFHFSHWQLMNKDLKPSWMRPEKCIAFQFFKLKLDDDWVHHPQKTDATVYCDGKEKAKPKLNQTCGKAKKQGRIKLFTTFSVIPPWGTHSEKHVAWCSDQSANKNTQQAWLVELLKSWPLTVKCMLESPLTHKKVDWWNCSSHNHWQWKLMVN